MKNKKYKNGLPEAFLERLANIVPKKLYSDVLETFNHTRPTTLRVNTLKTNVPDVEQLFTHAGIKFEKVLWSPLVFIITETPQRILTEMSEYAQGLFYIQGLSSMLPPLILNPQENETIIDLAAAPGSKTTQMAALMSNTGKIIANDNSPIRVYKLKANLNQQGVTNTIVTQVHGQILWQHYPEYADKTLVDVPCSMEGRIIATDPKSYEYWSVKKIKELNERQRFLLRAGISATKPGGTIIYSTCTLAPEENEQVIDWIMKKEEGNVQLESIDFPNLPTTQGLLQWKERVYHPDMIKTLRIIPQTNYEGFYIAKLRKISSSVPRSLKRDNQEIA